MIQSQISGILTEFLIGTQYRLHYLMKPRPFTLDSFAIASYVFDKGEPPMCSTSEKTTLMRACKRAFVHECVGAACHVVVLGVPSTLSRVLLRETRDVQPVARSTAVLAPRVAHT